MKKFSVTIKDNENDEIITQFDCEHLIAGCEHGCAIMIKRDDMTGMLTVVASIVEHAMMKLIERKLEPEERARCFELIKEKYDITDEEDMHRLQQSISDVFNMIAEAVMTRLYENTCPPRGDYKIKVVSPNNQVIKERNANDFGLISTFEEGTIAFFDVHNASEFKELDSKLFQTICNCIEYSARLNVAFTEDYKDDEISELMKKGDSKIYDLLNEKVEIFCDSVLGHLKYRKMEGLMRTNNLSMIIDEEEYYRQKSQQALNDVLKKLGFTKDEDDED